MLWFLRIISVAVLICWGNAGLQAVPPATDTRQPIELPARSALTRGAKVSKDAAGNLTGWSNDSDTVEWQQIKPVAGWYEVEITQACPTDAGTYEVTIDNQTITGHVKSTGGFDKFETIKLGFLQLGKNQTYLTLKATKIDGPFMKVSGIALRPCAAPVIEPNAAGAIELAAVAAAIEGPAIRIDFHGNITDVRVGCTISWPLLVKKAGWYEIEVSQGAQRAGGAFEVTVGGQKLAAESQPTGDWRTFKPNYIGEVQLKEGKTDLVILGTKQVSAVMSLQSVHLTPTSNPRPGPKSTAAGPVVAANTPQISPATGTPRPGSGTTVRPPRPPVPARPAKGPGRPNTKLPLNVHAPEMIIVKDAKVLIHPEDVAVAVFGADGSTLFTGASRGVTKIWNGVSGKEMANLTVSGHESVTAMALSPDKKYLAVSGDFKSIKLLNPMTGAELASWPLREFAFGATHLAWSPDSRKLAAISANKMAVFDVATKQATLVPLPPAVANLSSVAYSPNGLRLVACGNQQTPTHETRTCVLDCDPAGIKPPRVMDFDWVGKSWMAFVTSDTLLFPYGTQLALLDLPSGKIVGGYGGTDIVVCGAVSFDGRVAAVNAGLRDGNALIGVLDLANNTWIATLLGHDKPITSLAFSPDGKKLVSTSLDKTARIWEVPPPSLPPTDLKGIGQEILGHWEAKPVIDDVLIPGLLNSQHVPKDKIEAATIQMRKMMEGLALAYTFEGNGNVTVTVAGGGKTQEQKGHWEIVHVQENHVKVRLTGGGNPPDLLVLSLKVDDPDRLSTYMPDMPIRQPVEFQRVH